MTPDEELEYYVLRRYGGISMHEADHVLPAEEVEIFLRQHARVTVAEKGLDLDAPAESAGAPGSDPFFVAPPGFG